MNSKRILSSILASLGVFSSAGARSVNVEKTGGASRVNRELIKRKPNLPRVLPTKRGKNWMLPVGAGVGGIVTAGVLYKLFGNAKTDQNKDGGSPYQDPEKKNKDGGSPYQDPEKKNKDGESPDQDSEEKKVFEAGLSDFVKGKIDLLEIASAGKGENLFVNAILEFPNLFKRLGYQSLSNLYDVGVKIGAIEAGKFDLASDKGWYNFLSFIYSISFEKKDGCDTRDFCFCCLFLDAIVRCTFGQPEKDKSKLVASFVLYGLGACREFCFGLSESKLSEDLTKKGAGIGFKTKFKELYEKQDEKTKKMLRYVLSLKSIKVTLDEFDVSSVFEQAEKEIKEKEKAEKKN